MNKDDIRLHPEMEPEEPEFIIERDDEEGNLPESPQSPKGSKWKKWLLMAIAAIALIALAFGAYEVRRLYNDRSLGITISVSPKENIRKLEKAPEKEKEKKKEKEKEEDEVIHTSDSILGVELDFYKLHGLRASIEFKEPKQTDKSVYLYCRSADHLEDSTYLGGLVVNGEEKPSTQSRLGYMAMVDDRMVIGVSSDDAVKDYVKEKEGSFFRQFVLVSNGDVPPRFYLPGKKIRKAIGRMTEKKEKEYLVFISTRNEVTVRDFAKALREYGFIDAIYITGGPDYCYYRSKDGQRHDIGDKKFHSPKEWEKIIPWLVFRKI